MQIEKVLKFGGTSVGIAAEETLQIILSESSKIVVVVSALSGVTNQLIAAAKAAAANHPSLSSQILEIQEQHFTIVKSLIPPVHQSALLGRMKVMFNELEKLLSGIALVTELSGRSLDSVVSFGERLSAEIFSEALTLRGRPSRAVDARSLFVAEEPFGNGRLLFKETNAKIAEWIQAEELTPIVTGFIAGTINGETITLGRGGSDYTASILGSALGVQEIEIWTDVDGVLTADPRKVKQAFTIPELTYEEAMELSHFGAKVIYPPTMRPAMESGIPIVVKNTFKASAVGTKIASKTSSPLRGLAASGISSISKISLLRIQGSGMVGVLGISERLFGALRREGINIILISQASSEHSICIAVTEEDGSRAKEAIDSVFKLEIAASLVEPTILEPEASIISVVGEGMRNLPGVSARVFQSLGRNGVNVMAIAQGSSELNISIVINRAYEVKALNALHDSLFLSERKTINLFLVGVGLIGKTLLSQIERERERLSTERFTDIRVVGVSNSKTMLICEQGLESQRIVEGLAQSKERASVKEFISRMKSLNLANSVFIDCSASEEVAEHYFSVLDASIPVVTPNKKGQSGDLKEFQKLREVSRRRNVPFLFETSVGAALPVINTLRDLIRSGDKILRIEAVLSGTLSYIFNSLSAEKTLSSVVSSAMKLGLTEPDPRDDLNGVDMARKILILAREAGLALELPDVEIERFLPERCFAAPSKEAFLQELESYDSEFQKLIVPGTKLCYVASLRDGKCKLSLEKLTAAHPFFSLSGCDNIVAFYTERYSDTPLVVRGPGAGAEVTASGVFADIMRVVDYGA